MRGMQIAWGVGSLSGHFSMKQRVIGAKNNSGGFQALFVQRRPLTQLRSLSPPDTTLAAAAAAAPPLQKKRAGWVL
jgi:hypothetical protein